MRSFALVLATALTFFRITSALVAPQQRDTSLNPRGGVFNYIKDVFRLKARQEVCVQDSIYQSVQNYTSAQVFCSRYLGLAPATAVVDTTPTV